MTVARAALRFAGFLIGSAIFAAGVVTVLVGAQILGLV